MNRREFAVASVALVATALGVRKCATQLTPTTPEVQRSAMPTIIGYDLGRGDDVSVLVWRDTAGRIVFVQRGVS